jgi:hypothetical protein
MERFIVAAMLLAFAVAIAPTGVEARGYRYCLKTSAGPGDCKYGSYRQCKAAASGTGASCVRNYGPSR